MSDYKRHFLLILIMAIATLTVAGIAISLLYRAALDEERERLVETAQSQARLIEAIARFDAVQSRDYPEGSMAATLSQIIDAHENYTAAGETGEFTLARREGDDIVFLLRHRHYNMVSLKPVPFDSELAEPMRRALSGQSGIIIGLDYRGQTVLAAYEPVGELGWGIVAKIDMVEVRKPFIRAGAVATGAAILIVILGSVLFLRISSPMIRRLREYSERLEEMVAQRTKELEDAQEQLLRQEKLAVLGQLAGGVSHELRNPLGAIKNAAYFLNMALEDPEPEVKETLEILEKEVETSEKIIWSLLDFARPNPLSLREVDVNGIVEEALSRITVPENVQVVNQLNESLPDILADPDQLGQVFGNIILNATQAMPDGGQLTLESEIDGQDGVAISISDTGVGISRENLDKVFEPLFTTKARGIGLGLAVTNALARRHGGAIEVRSEVDKGSTFTIKLPVEAEQEGQHDE